ncbi:hypothetical protein P3S68_024800 [Capsicum galapagoense]
MDNGGIGLANLDDQQQNNSCPTSVVESRDDGIAVYFIPKNPKYQNIVFEPNLLEGAKDESSWFQIKPTTNRKYKIVFCLFDTYCQDIGIVPQSGYYFSVLSEDPMPFVYKLDNRVGMVAEA